MMIEAKDIIPEYENVLILLIGLEISLDTFILLYETWILKFSTTKLSSKFKNFDIYVDVKKNYGLFINLVEKKINYLEVQADQEVFTKLKSLAKVNKVLINPNFSILDLTKSKNIKKKIRDLK